MKPGHVEILLFIISFRIVCVGRVNTDWWRYLMSSDLDVMACTLYGMCLIWTVFVYVDVLLNSLIGNIHDLVCGYCPPFRTIFPL